VAVALVDAVEERFGLLLPQLADIRPRSFESTLGLRTSKPLCGQGGAQRLVLLSQLFPVIFDPCPIGLWCNIAFGGGR